MQEPVAFKEETKDFQLPVVIKATPFVLPEQALSEVEAPVQEDDAQLKKTLKNQTLKNILPIVFEQPQLEESISNIDPQLTQNNSSVREEEEFLQPEIVESKGLEGMVTKVAQAEHQDENFDAHKAHFDHTIQALSFIRSSMKVVEYGDIDKSKFVNLPPSRFDKVLILDMDETLIHCVDDIER
jgi:hypothetical protein